MISVLAQPGSNILLPKPGFPLYESRTTFSNLEVRHFDLIPERGWEVDLEGVQAIADENTVAIVVINPSNPCGSVYSYDHLAKVSIFLGQVRYWVFCCVMQFAIYVLLTNRLPRPPGNLVC